jgi:outer membrane lipoprotein LolB
LADSAFSLAGRISIRQQESAYHGTLNWQHTMDADELTLAGPLGQGVAELRRNAGGVVLQLPDGERHEAETLDALAGRLFGAPLPIAALPDWIRGIAPDAHLDEQKRPVRLVLPDWTVEWLRYGDDGRPQLISLESPNVGVRLRIDSWTEGVAARAQP